MATATNEEAASYKEGSTVEVTKRNEDDARVCALLEFLPRWGLFGVVEKDQDSFTRDLDQALAKTTDRTLAVFAAEMVVGRHEGILPPDQLKDGDNMRIDLYECARGAQGFDEVVSDADRPKLLRSMTAMRVGLDAVQGMS